MAASRMLGAFTFMLLVMLVSAKAATTFTFSLPISARTSAGVYTTDGTLVRTLWNEEPFAAGSHSRVWDDKDDAGNVAPGGAYTIKVMHHNVEYVWEGRVGNSSRRSTGDTNYYGYSLPNDLALAGTSGAFAMSFQEGQPLWRRFETSDPQTVSFSSLADARRQFAYADSDGTRVYFANEGNNFISDPYYWPSFVAAYNLSNNTQHSFSAGTSDTGSNPYWYGIIDKQSTPTEASWRLNRPTGIAVQTNGQVLAVSHEGQNQICLFDKVSGTLIKNISVAAPGRLSFAPDNTLWVTCVGGTGKRVVQQIINVPAAPNWGGVITMVQDPQDVCVHPANSNLIVVLDKGTHQVLGFDATGAKLWTLGQSGGYANGPDVTYDKFWFSEQSFVQLASDGSFWVGDTYNRRTLHFSASRQYLEQIAMPRTTRMITVDENNPRRVFGGFLEYDVNPAKELKPDNGSWKLLRNWGWGRATDTLDWFGLFQVLTLANGRTYALDGGPFEAYDPNLRNLLELTTSGIRDTGIDFFDTYADPKTRALDRDGSKMFVLQENGVQKSMREPLTGFDGNGNPVWGAAQLLGSAPMGPTDPAYRFVGPTGARTWLTDGGVAISFSPSADARNSGYHLGGVKVGGTNWLWKTSPTGWTDGKGTFQTYAQDSSVQYAGNYPHVAGRGIVYGYHGEFWCHPRFGDQGQGAANQFVHYWDNGLFVGQFGEPAMVQDWLIPAPVISKGMVAGAGGNAFSSTLVRPGTGNVYLYTGTEWASGIFRWRLDGYDGIWETQGNVQLGSRATLAPVAPLAGTGLLAEFFKGKNFEELRTVRVAPEVGFTLEQYSPDSDWVPVDGFSARWSGQIEAPVTGAYTFHATGDDGIRLWVNGVQLVNGWVDQGGVSYTGIINLTATQKYSIRYEFYENGGDALCKLEWTPPGQARQAIAKRYLSPATPASFGLARGIGLKGEYFSGGVKVVERVDPEINWPGLQAWPPAGVPSDNFTAKWTGKIRSAEAGNYVFRAAMNDGLQLRINGQLVIDAWSSGNLRAATSGNVSLLGDTLYDIQVDYFEGTGDEGCRIEWERPGSAKSVLIPTTRLYPSAEAAAGGDQPLVNGAIYELEPVNAPGKRLEVSGASTVNGARVQIWDDANAGNQRWKVISVGSGRYEFEPQHAIGKRMDVDQSGSADGTMVKLYDGNSSWAQRWRLISRADGSYEIAPECAPGSRLDVNGSSSANGATVQIWQAYGGSNQGWRFLKQ